MAGKQANEFLDNFVKEFDAWLNRHDYKNIDELKGVLLPLLSSPNHMNPIIPSYNQKLCIGCQSCVNICLEGAIKFKNGKIIIDKKKCVGCGACASVCLTKALK
jgi:ferredoxin